MLFAKIAQISSFISMDRRAQKGWKCLAFCHVLRRGVRSISYPNIKREEEESHLDNKPETVY